MTLTSVRGPFGPDPAGRFSVPLPPGVVYVEPFPRRVRARIGDRWVVDSEAALLVHRPGRPPYWAFPPADVPGIASEPEPDAPGHVRVDQDAADAWFEEEQQVFGHIRNPYHRVDCVPTRRRLTVAVAGTVVVDTDDTVGVYETSLFARLYVARSHVRTDLLEPSPTTTYCQYKGTASYWTAVVGETRIEDVAWSYDDPLPETATIGTMICFDPARADVTQQFPPGI